MYKKIIEKAEAEALIIKENGAKKAQEITNQIIKETEDQISKLLKEADEKNNSLIKTKTAEMEQTIKQQVLAKQKEIIKQTFNMALEQLLTLDDKALKELVITYMKKVEIDADIVIKVNSNDYAKYQKLFSSNGNTNLNVLTESLGIKTHQITLSNEHANIKGGFLVIGKYYDVDYSFETVLNSLQEELITEVSNMLFKSEE